MDSLISVIIPVYNVEKFVEESIMSICRQTYRNLEIIIIDDCSTDNTYFLVERIAKIDFRIKLIRNKENLKLVETLNKGLRYATGDYIVRMDGDDISELDRIEKMYKYLRRYPDVSLIGCQVMTIDENNNIIGYSSLPVEMKIIENSCIYASPILHIWMCKKSLYDELNGYRHILGAEDYDFILRVLSSGYKITNLNERLYRVRIRDGNTVSTIGLKQEISHQYCVSLYKERLKKGKDSFSLPFLLDKFKRSENKQENFSRNYHSFKKGFFLIKKRNFWGAFYIFTSIIKSEYIRSYFFNRIMYRLILLIYR